MGGKRPTCSFGHTPLSLKPERTLEKLYLAPLRERIKAQGGAVYRNGPPFYLMIDIKTDAKETALALEKCWRSTRTF